MGKIHVQIAGAGCGKTTELSRWSARAAARYGYHRVLVCSLTKTGARQASRDVELPPQQISTVHSFASRALGSPTVAESKIAEWNEGYPEWALSGSALDAEDAYKASDEETAGDHWKHEVARLRTLGTPPEKWHPRAQDFFVAWQQWKRHCGYLDFTDLITHAIAECPTAPGNPAVILLDEGQDTGALEMRLLMHWAKSVEHFVICADPQQQLFVWRGSDPLLVQRMWHEYDPDRQPLPQSYRLSRAVYDSAYTWAGRFTQTERISFAPREEEGRVEHVNWNLGEMTPRLVERLVTQYHSNDLRYPALMFLATCGYMLEPVLKSLREAGIPFHNPWRVKHSGWNPLPANRAKGKTLVDCVLAFLRPCPEVWGEHARFWTADDVKAWVHRLPAAGILTRNGKHTLESLPETTTDEAIAKAFGQWFTPEALPHIVPKPDLFWYLSLVKASDRFRDFVKAICEKRGAAILRETPRVVCGTVHSLKGSEATTVILAPDISPNGAQACRVDPVAREEMLRTMYVGQTRSRDTLLLCRPSSAQAVRWEN